MPDLAFSCTLCGQCCHNHSLPLTLQEAASWLEDGGEVNIYCDADIWPSEPPQRDLRAAHRRRRSFAAMCGSSRLRVTTLFIGVVSGPCRNLGEDLKCRIYARRPLVCRIYPAEINPFIQLNIAAKACPPEAWGRGDTLLSEGRIVDPDVQSLVEKSRQTDQDDAPQKALLCSYFGIDVTALTGEGFATYAPHPDRLLAALRQVRAVDPKTTPNERSWRLYSPSAITNETLRAMGLDLVANKLAVDRYSFLSAPSIRLAEPLPT